MLEQLLALSAATRQAIELIKPYLPNDLSENSRNAILVLLSVIIGVIGSVGLQLNILAVNDVYGQLHPAFGYVLTGALCAFGSNALHAALALLQYKKETEKQNAVMGERVLSGELE